MTRDQAKSLAKWFQENLGEKYWVDYFHTHGLDEAYKVTISTVGKEVYPDIVISEAMNLEEDIACMKE